MTCSTIFLTNSWTEISERIFSKTKRKSWTNHETKLRRLKRPKTKHVISKRWVTIPNLKKDAIISCASEKTVIKVTTNTGARIKEILSNKEEKNHSSEENSIVSEIPCIGQPQDICGWNWQGGGYKVKRTP